MKRIVYVAFISVLVIGSILSGANTTIKLNKIMGISNNFGFNAINIDNTTIKITLNIVEFEFGSVKTEKGLFTTIELPGYSYPCIEGQAKLPIIRKMVEIPIESKPELIVISKYWDFKSLDELNLPNKILPVQPSVEKTSELDYKFVIDEEYYSTCEFMPENIANIVDMGEIRSRCFALIEISPVQYNPTLGELRLMKSCEIIIDLPNSNLDKTYENIKRYSTPTFESLFEATFSNYGAYENCILNNGQEGYLIIVYDNFYDEIEPFADWKTTMGFDITITKTSKIPGGATKENIHDYIEDAYNNWTIPPAYVLLVGDTPQIPIYNTTNGPDAIDLYYVTINSEDYFPDIFIGRFPASNGSQVTAMVNKTIYYEKGIFSKDEWIKKAAFMAGIDCYTISEGTHNYVISNYLEPNGYTCNKLYNVTYGADTQDVIDTLNDGRSLAIYSGHGGWTKWVDGPPFNQNNIKELTNKGMYPFVCSHACLTGSFQVSECFGETWLREADKGGLAFWGASESTFWYEDDILEKGMFQAFWDDDLDWISGMTDMGLYYLYENFSGGGHSQYYFEAYNILGDPSVRIWRNDSSDAPNIPSKPDGPDYGVPEEEYEFYVRTIDPEGDHIYYQFDWGDGKYSGWEGPFNSGEMGSASHSWIELGDYNVRARARDVWGKRSDWSNITIFSIVKNTPPNKPTITGPKSGKTGITYEFMAVATDPDGQDLFYNIFWGNAGSGDAGPFPSGEEQIFEHTWERGGFFTIKVLAKDKTGAWSETGKTNIFIIKNRAVENLLLERLFQRLPDMFPVLRYLIGII